jgi:hypothetical protein
VTTTHIDTQLTASESHRGLARKRGKEEKTIWIKTRDSIYHLRDARGLV